MVPLLNDFIIIWLSLKQRTGNASGNALMNALGNALGECFGESIREILWECLEERLGERLEGRSGLPGSDKVKCSSHEASALYHNFTELFLNNNS